MQPPRPPPGAPATSVGYFGRAHNLLLDPTRLVHRRVYEAVGGYHPDYTLAQDFHFWLRAAPAFRFRHVAGGPLIKLRRHGDNFSDESAPLEIDQVERALWVAGARAAARARARGRLAAAPRAGEREALKLLAGPSSAAAAAARLARGCAQRAARVPASAAPPRPRARSS